MMQGRLELLELTDENQCSIIKYSEKYTNLSVGFIYFSGELAVKVSNGFDDFLCCINDKRVCIEILHFSKASNPKKKMKYHKHDRVFFDWEFCLDSLSRNHKN